MRYYKTLALCVAMLAVPAMTMAQKNIKAAFDKFVNAKGVTVNARHMLERDPETGLKEGQYDIYTYTIPKSKMSLLKDVEAAFEKDKDKAYSYTSGVNGDGNSAQTFAVGDGTGSGVSVATKRGSYYMTAAFSDPEDAMRKYRYAYAMDRIERGDSVTGRLVITYATTLKYRNSKSRQSYDMSGMNNSDYKDSGSWLAEFNIYSKKLKEDPSSSFASVYVNQIYNLSKRSMSLTRTEKDLVITEIKTIQKDITDNFMKSLLNSAIEKLK